MKKILLLLFAYLIFSASLIAQWQQLNIGTTQFLTKISCPNDSTCFTGGNSGVLYKTTNYGDTWNSLNIGFPTTIVSIQFHDALNGFILGYNGLLFFTQDGGNNWSSIVTPVGGGDGAVWFVSSGGNVTHKTTDRGQSWVWNSSFSTNAYDFAFIDDSIGIAVGGSTYFNQTFNQGNSGLSISNPGPTSATYNTATSVGDSALITVNGAGDLIRSNDFGNTWQFMGNVGNGTAIWGMDFMDSDTGFVVDNSGDIYKTENGGISWSLNHDGTVYLQDVFCPSTSVAYAVGGNGQIWRYRNTPTIVNTNKILPKRNRVLVSPNPNKGKISLDISSLKDVDIVIYDMYGRIVYQDKNINSPIYQFELNEISGIYILVVNFKDGEKEISKLIKN
jgi:photosystem II stability/assembly factor-like uncharacterized protein